MLTSKNPQPALRSPVDQVLASRLLSGSLLKVTGVGRAALFIQTAWGPPEEEPASEEQGWALNPLRTSWCRVPF